uniref:Uncharacterized protein n=1 Tax=Podarcis muralis TaxID=64176 RepID=A0A670HXK5_PODMU
MRSKGILLFLSREVGNCVPNSKSGQRNLYRLAWKSMQSSWHFPIRQAMKSKAKGCQYLSLNIKKLWFLSGEESSCRGKVRETSELRSC